MSSADLFFKINLRNLSEIQPVRLDLGSNYSFFFMLSADDHGMANLNAVIANAYVPKLSCGPIRTPRLAIRSPQKF